MVHPRARSWWSRRLGPRPKHDGQDPHGDMNPRIFTWRPSINLSRPKQAQKQLNWATGGKKPKYPLRFNPRRRYRMPEWIIKQWKPFEASKLLLDMDAYESKLIRPFNEADEELLRIKWGKNPVRQKLKEAAESMAPEIQVAHQRFNNLVSKKSNGQWLVNDLDLMMAALHGTPVHKVTTGPQRAPDPDAFTDPGGSVGRLQHVAIMNAIPLQSMHHSRNFLDWLLHRRTLSEARGNPKLTTAKQWFSREANDSEEIGYYGWWRLVLRIARKSNGPQTLACGSKEIATTFQEALRVERRSSSELLGFLNSLRLVMAGAGYRPGFELSAVGFLCAAHNSDFDAMRLYLNEIQAVEAGRQGFDASDGSRRRDWADDELLKIQNAVIMNRVPNQKGSGSIKFKGVRSTLSKLFDRYRKPQHRESRGAPGLGESITVGQETRTAQGQGP